MIAQEMYLPTAKNVGEVRSLSDSISMITTAVITLTAAYIGYKASLKQAEKNFELTKMQRQFEARKRIAALLGVTREKVTRTLASYYMNYDSGILTNAVFDPEWPKELALLDNLTYEERTIIIIWLTDLQNIEEKAKHQSSIVGIDYSKAIRTDLVEEIEKIINKLSR